MGIRFVSEKDLELFVINDYDSGKPLSYYLTDDARKCYDLLSGIDSLDTDCKDAKGNYIKDEWEYHFVKRCRGQGVFIKRIEVGESYNY